MSLRASSRRSCGVGRDSPAFFPRSELGRGVCWWRECVATDGARPKRRPCRRWRWHRGNPLRWLRRLRGGHPQVVAGDRQVSAGGEADEIEGVGCRKGFVEIVHAPDQAAFCVAPGAEVFDVQIADAEDDGSFCELLGRLRASAGASGKTWRERRRRESCAISACLRATSWRTMGRRLASHCSKSCVALKMFMALCSTSIDAFFSWQPACGGTGEVGPLHGVAIRHWRVRRAWGCCSRATRRWGSGRRARRLPRGRVVRRRRRPRESGRRRSRRRFAPSRVRAFRGW